MLRDPISGNTSGWEFMIKFLLSKAKETDLTVPYDQSLQMPDYTKLK